VLPIRHRSIFKSRWVALLWAAGIVWAACSFAGAAPADDNASANADAASAALNGF
jgi:hypothetical protein